MSGPSSAHSLAHKPHTPFLLFSENFEWSVDLILLDEVERKNTQTGTIKAETTYFSEGAFSWASPPWITEPPPSQPAAPSHLIQKPHWEVLNFFSPCFKLSGLALFQILGYFIPPWVTITHTVTKWMAQPWVLCATHPRGAASHWDLGSLGRESWCI